ncbi:MAG TPA: DUF1508 domain-containing protein [Geobacter sp.]|nr:DUF1508 domain-containing protein [Geobacter sp.]
MVKFEIFKGTDGQHYFRLKGANGEKIAQSEGYARKQSAIDIIATIKKEAATAAVTDEG